MAHALEVFPRGILSTEYLVSLNGEQVATVSTEVPATCVLDGHRFRLSSQQYAEHPLTLLAQLVQRAVTGHSYRLEREGEEGVLAEARPSGIFPHGFSVSSEGQEYQLEWILRSRRFQIVHDGVPLGWIAGQGRLSRKLHGELAAELSLPLQLFLAWLVLIRRETVHPD